MNRHWMMLLFPSAAILLGACGSVSVSSPLSTVATTTTTAVSATSTATTPPGATTTVSGPATSPSSAVSSSLSSGSSPGPCSTSQLAARLTSGGGGYAGGVQVSLDLINTSSTTCSLAGFPGVSFVTGTSGRQVGAPAVRTHAGYSVVTLGPGEGAQAALQIVDAFNYPASSCQLVTTTGLRVYPPNQTRALFVASPQRACLNSGIGALMVGPMVAGPLAGGTGT